MHCPAWAKASWELSSEACWIVRRPKSREGAFTRPAGGVSHATSSSSVGVIDVQHQDDDSESEYDERPLGSHAIEMTPEKDADVTPQKLHGR